jgi:ribonuclease Z
VAWCTDTAYDAENVELARGVRALFHEAFHADDRTDDPGHTAAGEAARLAAEAEVEQLVLIHVNPEHDDDEALLTAARARFSATDVGVDGFEVLLEGS